MKMSDRRQSPSKQQHRRFTLPALIFGSVLVCTVLQPPAIASYRVPITRDGEGRQSDTGDSDRRPAHRFVGGFIDDSPINRDDRLSAPSHRHDHARKHHDGFVDRGCYGADVISTETTAGPATDRRHTVVKQHRGVHRTTGPVHTYIKTDKNGHFKWGVRHFVGSKYAR